MMGSRAGAGDLIEAAAAVRACRLPAGLFVV